LLSIGNATTFSGEGGTAMRDKLKLSRIVWVLLVMVMLTLAGCGGGGIQIQSPIKKATPPPVTQQQAFTVAPNQIRTVYVSVSAGDRLTGSFTIQGGSGNDVDFSIKDPSGNTVSSGGRVSSSWQFDFVCSSTGSYQLLFDNGFSIVSNKAINLTTTVYHSQ
jgi:predicted small lipoprotein YifL